MNMQLLLVVFVSALSGVATSLLSERWNNPPPRIAVIDPTVLVTEQLKQLQPGLDEAAIQARGQAYARRLDQAIAQIAQQYNAVILVSPAVISGAPDLTQEVRRSLNELR